MEKIECEMSNGSETNPKDSASYENPNFRKLYAKLSMNSMIAIKLKHSNVIQSTASSELVDLPEGWERHEDELGPYFWHIPTGTIQRERPFLNTIDKSMIRSDSLVFLDKSAIQVDYNLRDSIDYSDASEIKTLNANSEEDGEKQRSKAFLQAEKILSDDEDDDDRTNSEQEELSFMVHSLGWLDVEESQINSQTGSLVIKKCIYELSVRADNAARCWGPNETQSLLLKINGERILLLEPNTSTTLSVQLIQEIRLWAVDECNNFAYVVKDRKSGKPGTVKCHVFHCDEHENTQTAQQLALYLKDALVRLKNRTTNLNERPKDLFLNATNLKPIENFEFPAPSEEPRNTFHARYIGYVAVPRPMGVELLNMAIDEAVNALKMSLTSENSCEIELMRPVVVQISPSNILVECQETGSTLVECRVRYLSFLGISLDNIKRCGFIMQVNENKFVCHCFEVDPSAGSFCKSIETACKLRYQKCLDAHAKMKKIPICHQNRNQLKNCNTDKTQKVNGDESKFTFQTSPVAVIKSSISGVFNKILNSQHSQQQQHQNSSVLQSLIK
ncbi:amyloid beta A4 precursor protein-binding family B member 2-like protein [Sarcoptes scabiei]|uniref:Amyloid beta A4 protein-binding family B member 2-like protein n=2 Tax=Sarcoptes scabiei TaxID=52283 RepID=A0A131ZWL4_SARSC|nr:amyloid beta A4 precursor protein-binding family B member 2-like protein [Sarcoptes scabiei]